MNLHQPELDRYLFLAKTSDGAEILLRSVVEDQLARACGGRCQSQCMAPDLGIVVELVNAVGGQRHRFSTDFKYWHVQHTRRSPSHSQARQVEPQIKHTNEKATKNKHTNTETLLAPKAAPQCSATNSIHGMLPPNAAPHLRPLSGASGVAAAAAEAGVAAGAMLCAAAARCRHPEGSSSEIVSADQLNINSVSKADMIHNSSIHILVDLRRFGHKQLHDGSWNLCSSSAMMFSAVMPIGG